MLTRIKAQQSLIPARISTRGFLYTIFLFLSSLFVLGSQTAFGQCIGVSLTRGSGEDTLDFGQVLVGAQLDSTYRLLNDTSSELIVLDRRGIRDTAFSLVTFSDTVKVADSSALTERFIPNRLGLMFGEDTLVSSLCGPINIVYRGTGMPQTSNGATIDILNSTNAFIGIKDTGAVVTRSYYLKNSSGSTVQIDSIHLPSDSTFALKQTVSFPDRLKNGDSIQFVIAFTASDTILHRSQCIIATQPPILTEAVALQGIRTSLNEAVRVWTAPIPFALSVMPNPSHGDVTLIAEGMRKGTAEVVDILGRTLQSASITNNWIWNGVTFGGSHAPNGVYILRVSGIDQSGHQVVASKRVVLQR
jgi:hypothetical protein